MRLTRRGFLKTAAGAVVGAAATDAFLVEPDAVEFTAHHIPLADGTTSGPTLRFAQLSDLHVTGVARQHAAIAERIAAERLDFLLITGDAVDEARRLSELDDVLSLFDPGLPKYAILGNWEHWGRVNVDALRSLYAHHNAELLVNRTALLTCRGTRLNITGLDDLVGGAPSLARAMTDTLDADHDLLLAHCPAHRDGLFPRVPWAHGGDDPADRSARSSGAKEYRPRVILSGHTHGGQTSILGWRPYLPPGSGTYVEGWYRDREPHMYVSRGVGTSVLRARFASMPEVPIFTMEV